MKALALKKEYYQKDKLNLILEPYLIKKKDLCYKNETMKVTSSFYLDVIDLYNKYMNLRIENNIDK